jgi:hypothetical protein
MKTDIGQTTGCCTFTSGYGTGINPVILVLTFIFLLGYRTVTMAQRTEINVNIELPSWAPDYHNANLVQYYYLPDIESYYDVRNHEFIYPEDGRWMFGRSLPPVYAWFDLNNCFIIALDARVYEPWRHFHYYLAHYPRFYYRSFYKDAYGDHAHPMRGFDENERNVVYNHRPDKEYNAYRRGNESGHEVNKGNDHRQRDEAQHLNQERKAIPAHPSEPMHYYGRNIGKPVKVEKQMRRAKETSENHEKQHREK